MRCKVDAALVSVELVETLHLTPRELFGRHDFFHRDSIGPAHLRIEIDADHSV